MKQSHKTLLLWVLLIVMFLAIWQVLQPGERKQQVSFSEFVTGVHAGQVPDVRIKDREYQFTHVVDGKNSSVETLGPVADEALIQDLENNPLAKDAEVQGLLREGRLVALLVVDARHAPADGLPRLMFFLFMRQLQAGGGKAMSFGKAKARMLSDSQNKVTFADVAGIDEAKDEVEEIIAFLKDPKKFQRLGGRIPKGVLMMGPPGTGKTLLARAIAGEAGVPFFSISGSDFVEMFVGVGASRVRDLFEQGKKHAPCIIFIDEIDAVGRHRGAGLGGGHDEREQTLNQLLVEMDGFESNEGVIIIAATNRPDVLDPAILRPGRFDRRITVTRPDVRGREAILRVHTKRAPLVAGRRPRDHRARHARLRRRRSREPRQRGGAPRRASGQGRGQRWSTSRWRRTRSYMGTERRSMVISDEEKRNTAVHEAGHTLVAVLITHHDPVHKVTIIPRGPGARRHVVPPEGRPPQPLEGAGRRRSIAVALGGRIAEEIVFGQITTGAGNDIKQGDRDRARDGVRVGHEREARPARVRREGRDVFLGRDYGQRRAGLLGADRAARSTRRSARSSSASTTR